MDVGIAGCGTVAAEVHIPLLKEFPGVRIAALAERDEELLGRAGTVVEGAELYQDYEKMLAQEALDAVFITLPTHLHATATSKALSAGVAVYVEKPLAANYQEASALMDQWRACEPRPVVMVGYNFRRSPVFVELHQLMKNGKVGRIHHIHSVNSRSFDDIPDWKLSPDRGGGVILDLATHHLDLWEHLLGQRIERVSAQISDVRFPHDTATLEAVTDGGVTCTGFFSFRSVEEDRISVYGETGRLTVERMGDLRVTYQSASSRLVRLKKLVQTGLNVLALPRLLERYRAPWSCPSYARSIGDFLDAVTSGVAVKPDLEDGLRVMELVGVLEGRRKKASP